jgi:hypothetical protein
MPEDNWVRARMTMLRRYIPPLTERQIQASITPAEIDAWFATYCDDGLTRDETIKRCCDELGASQADARAGWTRRFPREEGETRGGYGKRLTRGGGK